ncbi:MAG TPA: hypothetical protein VFQ38_12705 [Longimicrobiales bacterium]|nr:hypothetical protein [Longimicrobiales bacterium]
MPSLMLLQALRHARASTPVKVVWLVYQINEDDDSIGTLTSNATSFGELYEGLKAIQAGTFETFRARKLAAVDSEFDRRRQMIEDEALTKVLTLMEEGQALRRELDRVDAQKAAKLRKLETEKKTTVIDTRKALKPEETKGVAVAKGAAAAVMNAAYGAEHPEDDRHAEENFIARWSSILRSYSKGPIRTVDLYLNFSPCTAGSKARTIDQTEYSKGCLHKLEQLASGFKDIQWRVFYDALYPDPSTEVSRLACVAVNQKGLNLKLYRRA